MLLNMTNQEEIEITKENDIAVIGKRFDGIIHIFYKKGVTINPEAIEKVLGLILDFVPVGKKPFLIEADDYVTFQDEGRIYMSQNEYRIPSSKIAMLLENIGYRLILNHYIKNNTSKKDYNIFNEIDPAVEWLLKD